MFITFIYWCKGLLCFGASKYLWFIWEFDCPKLQAFQKTFVKLTFLGSLSFYLRIYMLCLNRMIVYSVHLRNPLNNPQNLSGIIEHQHGLNIPPHNKLMNNHKRLSLNIKILHRIYNLNHSRINLGSQIRIHIFQQ
jgi:hypothetical protein